MQGSCHLKVLSTYEGIDFPTTTPEEDDLLILSKKLTKFATLLGGTEAVTLLPFTKHQDIPDIPLEKFIKYQGRPAIPLTDEFKEVYWLFENFFIDEQTASSNIHYKMAKNSFCTKCRLYELSDSYKADLKKQHELYQTADKPKRQGKVPEWFTEDFMAEVELEPDTIEEI